MNLLEIKNIHKIAEFDEVWKFVRVLKSTKSYMFSYHRDGESVVVKIRRKPNTNGYYKMFIDDKEVWGISLGELKDIKGFADGIQTALQIQYPYK